MALRSRFGATGVWFFSTLLHLPNAFFGLDALAILFEPGPPDRVTRTIRPETALG